MSDLPIISPMKTIANAKPNMAMTVEHELLLPELCPKSHNPKPGSTLCIKYQAGEKLLELFSLDAFIASYIGHPIVRDMEYFTQVVAQTAADLLGVSVTCQASLAYNMLQQNQRIEVIALPACLAH